MSEKKVGGYRTGFCGSGEHEGTRPKSPSGVPMKVCTFWEICTCSCHVEITEMFTMTGQKRIEVGNPEYLPFQSTFWMPDLAERTEAAVERMPIKLEGDEPPVFAETADGRAAHGQLEYKVKRVTDAWMASSEREPLTPGAISAAILANDGEGAKPHSQGAIQAVLIRWQRIGYCDVGSKPVRFDGLTVEGMEFGLDRLKARKGVKK